MPVRFWFTSWNVFQNAFLSSFFYFAFGNLSAWSENWSGKCLLDCVFFCRPMQASYNHVCKCTLVNYVSFFTLGKNINFRCNDVRFIDFTCYFSRYTTLQIKFFRLDQNFQLPSCIIDVEKTSVGWRADHRAAMLNVLLAMVALNRDVAISFNQKNVDDPIAIANRTSFAIKTAIAFRKMIVQWLRYVLEKVYIKNCIKKNLSTKYLDQLVR